MGGQVSGIDYMRDPKLFKGMAFTLEERQTLGIHGLLPPRIKSQEEMAEHSLRNLRRFEDPLNKYMYMADLLERNEKLFYKVLSENTAELMPIVYTPTVGLACQRFGLAFKRPKGLFITIHDKGHVYEVLKNWPEQDVRCIVVTVAGVLAALKATNTKLSDHTFLFQGAGEAALGIANLICLALEKMEGISFKEASKKVWLKDSRGLIVKDRPEGGISSHKAPFAHEHAPMAELDAIVKELKPTVLIGAAAIPNVFTPEIIKDMATFNKQPVIFALSNPTSMAECTAEQAYVHSEGRAVFASGSPFPAYEGFGKKYEPGQGNNAYIFPGVSLGVICTGIHHISDNVFLSAAEGLADMVQDTDIAVGRLYPPLSALREISVKIATKVATEAYKSGSASTYPEPVNKESFIRQQLYDYTFNTALPTRYDWPEEAFKKTNSKL